MGRLGGLVIGLIGSGPRISDLDPYRRSGSDAYDLIQNVQGPGWARLAAWNAYVLQVYGDAVLASTASGRWIDGGDADFARTCWSQACVWVEQARKAQASAEYAFGFPLPSPLPHWSTPLRSNAELAAMRSTLDTARTRVSSDIAAAAAAVPDKVRVQQAQLDAEWGYVEQLWDPKPTDDLRASLGDGLAKALDQAYQVGQLLAQPELLRQVL